ncbi:alpha/beta hydrolase [Streptomyces eurocidicus]|uniref:Pimeloyl-ACP methyl ester carboxylesterase n=1 Tax=Streptomyces eurocidicus TaxID=66423 RepID=A0A7W8BFS7_STREU|nr:alpha/beta hydrolase [Streptomyces eurocidicus]MBB5122112.1 pimeloyl-ACP methyl ester carboxylesterase [Streptomyces eurocidicus]
MTRRRHIVLSTLTLLTATLAPAAHAAPTPASSPELPVAWKPCAENPSAQCGTIRVPLDWKRTTGEQIDVRVARVPARDRAHRVGSLLFNPGGPGGQGATMLAYGQADLLFPGPLRDRFDIVSLDPRGTGGSRALECGPVLDPGQVVFPGSTLGYEEMRRSSRARGERCLARYGALVRNVDTVSVARDMDVFRAALGEERLNYLGVSYGSHLGATYARLFPHRVRAMVLDGPMDHSSGPTRFLREEAAAMEEEFGRFAAWCAEDAACALHGEDVGAVYDRVVARADRTPIPAPGGGEGAAVDGDRIRMTLPVQLLRVRLIEDATGTNAWVNLAAELAAADRRNDASGLLRGGGYVGAQDSPYTAVSCLDFPPQFTGYADAAARLDLARRVAPRTGAAVEGWVMSASCADWPVEATNPWQPAPVRGAPPILIAANTHDPATPLPGARRLHQRIAGSRLLVTEVNGHVSYYNSGCARERETAYLISARMPARLSCPG